MKIISTLISFFLLSIGVYANNVVVTNVAISGTNTTGHYSQVNFDISWENSWRTSTNEANYDGCWVFVKFRRANTTEWLPATIDPYNQVTPGGSVIKTSSDQKGVWIYRNANGIGNVNFAGAGLRWNYGADGVADNDLVEIKVFAVEMVYVPKGPFYLGNTSTETNKFRDGAQDKPFYVTSENAITVGTQAGNLYPTGMLGTSPIPATFPKGFNAFWIMKYEASRQQICDFLNTQTQTIATTRNTIGATGTVPNMVVSNPERAAEPMSVATHLAWLDWAGMRPFTEMEYEKGCRGMNVTPSPDEYAWGNTNILQVSSPLNMGAANETWTVGNANYDNSVGAIRTGALATPTSTRESSGATYYGIMEMSGNLYELTMSAYFLSSPFTGKHGDGLLNANGEANESQWTDSYLMAKGGSYAGPSYTLRTSERGNLVGYSTIGTPVYGSRGARTAE